MSLLINFAALRSLLSVQLIANLWHIPQPKWPSAVAVAVASALLHSILC